MRTHEEKLAYGRSYAAAHRETRREQLRQWQEKNRERTREHQRARYRREAEWLRERKKAAGSTCLNCGGTFDWDVPRQLHFHHRDPAQKSFTIGQSPSRSRAAIEAEIAKCDILCGDCHRLQHKPAP